MYIHVLSWYTIFTWTHVHQVETAQMSNSGWTDKPILYVHTMEYYSPIKGNETWISKILCLVEEARHKRTNIVLFHWYEVSGIDKLTEIERRLGIARAQESAESGSYCLIHKGLYFGMIEIFWTSIEVVVMQCECTKCYWIVHFKMISFIWISPQYTF